MMPDNRLPRHVLNTLHKNSIGESWFSQVHNIFSHISKDECYNNLEVCNLDECKDVLLKYSESCWKQNVNAKTKLQMYKLF